MSQTAQATFRDLSRDEAEAVLRRNAVGRLAYSRADQVDVEPVSYVYADEWLWCRTSEGAKWHALADTAYRWAPVAFEVDEVEGPFSWRSVVVKGGFNVIDPVVDGGDPAVWAQATTELRRLVPEALTEADPTPARDRLFRIAVQELTGREALPPSPARSPEPRAGDPPDARRPQ